MISLVNKYLSLNFYLDATEELKELFLSYSNYPNIFAATDSLDRLLIENLAIKVPKEGLTELPNFFLDFFDKNLVLVTKTEKRIQVDTEKGRKKMLTIGGFSKGWNEIFIAIVPNQNSIEEVKSNSKGIVYFSTILWLALLSILYNDYGISNVILLFISMVGVLVSIFIIQEKFGLKNRIVSKFCNTNPKASCDSVLQSGKGEINKWISFTDLPLLFFSINIMALLLNPIASTGIIGCLNILWLPVIAYSISIQKFQMKKWCILCLVASVLIVFQVYMGYFLYRQLLLFDAIFFNGFIYSFSFVTCTSILLVIIPALETKFKAEGEVKELRRFKKNPSVLGFLSKKIPAVERFEKLQTLQFGNRNSSVVFAIFLSYSCRHCHKAFEDTIDLIHKYLKRVFWNVLFTINPENNDNPYKGVAESLLAINNTFLESIKESISDWHIHKMGLEVWLGNWKVDSISMKVNQQIRQHFDWCLVNECSYTLTKIINKKLFSNEYVINELKIFSK